MAPRSNNPHVPACVHPRGPIYADWNETHLFNERWAAHARFHGVISVSMAVLLSAFGLVEQWAAGATGFAAAIPIAYWGSFFVARAVPGTSLEDPPHLVARPLGVPINILIPAVVAVLAAIGWLLAR